MTFNYYLVTTSEACFTFIGLARRHGNHIALCAPSGQEVMRVARKHVRQVTREETARRLQAEADSRRQRN